MGDLPLIIQLLSGAAGGNLADKFLPKATLGTMGNSILGILGGGFGGSILGSLDVPPEGRMDLLGIIGNIDSGGIGGGLLVAVAGILKGMFASKN